jgi:hypothetical protein
LPPVFFKKNLNGAAKQHIGQFLSELTDVFFVSGDLEQFPNLFR